MQVTSHRSLKRNPPTAPATNAFSRTLNLPSNGTPVKRDMSPDLRRLTWKANSWKWFHTLLVRAVLTFPAKIMEPRSEEMTNTSPLLTQGRALHRNPGHSAGPSSIFFGACPLGFCWMAQFMLTWDAQPIEMRMLSFTGQLSSPWGQGIVGPGPPREEMLLPDE